MSDYPEFEAFLKSKDGGNCIAVKFFPERNQYAAIKPLLYHLTMIVGEIGDKEGYENSYCYKTIVEAMVALNAWNGEGDPELWFRNPKTGRRRENGDREKEYIAW
jgi:hypothetical protein